MLGSVMCDACIIFVGQGHVCACRQKGLNHVAQLASFFVILVGRIFHGFHQSRYPGFTLEIGIGTCIEQCFHVFHLIIGCLHHQRGSLRFVLGIDICPCLEKDFDDLGIVRTHGGEFQQCGISVFIGCIDIYA